MNLEILLETKNIFDEKIWPIIEKNLEENFGYEKEKKWYLDTFKNGLVVKILENEEKTNNRDTVFSSKIFIGFVLLDFPEKNICWISNISIKEKFQSQGIGKKVMFFVEIFLKNKNIEKINFTVLKKNKRAIKFYENLGYEKIKNYEDKIFYKMEKII